MVRDEQSEIDAARTRITLHNHHKLAMTPGDRDTSGEQEI